MADALRFDGKVVVITGAGGGLGRAYALAFASRGAKVVVNDLGTSTDGKGTSSKAADKVVEEIKKSGGQAVANYDSVEHGDKIVKTAIDSFGRIDILINNAGILRDVSFVKMTDQDWELINKVHLYGAYKCSRAAWNFMRDQGFGRIIMTASAAGLYGNFGQANYSAAKLALLGFSNSLAIEGAKRNVYCNTIAPLAGSRMTETIMPPDLVAALKPEFVAPLVLYLCHEKTDVNGAVFEVGAGWISRLRWQRTQGAFLDPRQLSMETLAKNWSTVNDWKNATNPSTVQDTIPRIMEHIQKVGLVTNPTAAKKTENIDLDKALGHKFTPSKITYTEKEVSLYALAIGEGTDPLDPKQLQFVYENNSAFRTLPTMGVCFPFSVLSQVVSTPGLSFNPMMLLHGEQYLELKRPIPVSGTLTSNAKIAGIYDKGKGALVLIDAVTTDEQGQEICFNQFSLFIRGIGGFGGDRGPAGDANTPPTRAPDAVAAE
jgi:NAD(P)-dependent dehydrogenase (short-subunit alcohol dehydrogenase family)